MSCALARFASRCCRHGTVLGSLAIVMCTTRASACEVCAALGCSNAFRFGIVWFYVFLIWVAAAIAATAELIIRRQSGPRPLTLRRGLLLIAFPVAGLAGVHFLLLAALPVFVWPYLKKHDAPGPTWFRHFSRAVAIVLALSILPAYWMFPVIPTEGDIHARVSQTRANMKQLGGRLDQMASEKGLPPSSTEVAAGQTTFSVLNPSSLTQGSGARLLLEDPFANPPRQAPLIAIVAVFFPRSLFDPSWRLAACIHGDSS